MQSADQAEEIRRAIILRPLPDEDNQFSQAVFELKFQVPQLDQGKKLELKLKEVKEKDGKRTLEPVKSAKGVELSMIGILENIPNQNVLRFNMSRSSGLPKQDSFQEPGWPRVGFDVWMEGKPAQFFVGLPAGGTRKLVLETEMVVEQQKKRTITSPEVEVSSNYVIDDEAIATYGWDEGNSVQFYSNSTEGPKGDESEKDADGNHGAFYDIGEAIKKAEKFIFIADWSFHPYARLTHKPNLPLDINDTIGAILINKAKKNKDMVIAIHTWDHTALFVPDPQNDHADQRMDAIAKMLDPNAPGRPTNLLFRRSSRTGIGWSHHQKYVISDCEAENDPKKKEVKVFFGGLDLTKGRFDWWAHPIMPDHKDSKQFLDGYTEGKTFYDDWYSPEFKDSATAVRQPWHDIHAQLTGATARDFVREFIGRWNKDPSMIGTKASGNTSAEDARKVTDVLTLIRDETKFVQRIAPREPKAGGFTGQVLRSIDQQHWSGDAKQSQKAYADFKAVKDAERDAGKKLEEAKRNLEKSQAQPPDDSQVVAMQKEFEAKSKLVESAPWYGTEGFVWKVDGTFEKSIQEAYINAIKRAQKSIYIETQYIIGSGLLWGRDGVKNKIPETIVSKISSKLAKGEDFHVYMVIPMFPEGSIVDGGLVVVRRFEWATMRPIAYNVRAAVRKYEDVLKKAGRQNPIWQDYISFYYLARWDGVNPLARGGGSHARAERAAKNKRYMIYVHSKLMIVDDWYAILGSANLNERSLAGDRDTEICVQLSPNDDLAAKTVKKFRLKLWGELLGNGTKQAAAKKEWDNPETAECVKSVRAATNANNRAFRSGKFNNEGFLCRYEFVLGKDDELRFATNLDEEKDILPPKGDGSMTWEVIPDAENDGLNMLIIPEVRWNALYGLVTPKSWGAALGSAGE